jgi:hypothetical protein
MSGRIENERLEEYSYLIRKRNIEGGRDMYKGDGSLRIQYIHGLEF